MVQQFPDGSPQIKITTAEERLQKSSVSIFNDLKGQYKYDNIIEKPNAIKSLMINASREEGEHPKIAVIQKYSIPAEQKKGCRDALKNIFAKKRKNDTILLPLDDIKKVIFEEHGGPHISGRINNDAHPDHGSNLFFNTRDGHFYIRKSNQGLVLFPHIEGVHTFRELIE